MKRSATFLPHDDETVTVMPKEFGEKNKVEELKVIIVIEGDVEYIKKL